MKFKFVVAGYIDMINEKEVRGYIGQLMVDGGIKTFAMKVDKEK